jgi:energy-coupling factor transport system ATP-binding protein
MSSESVVLEVRNLKVSYYVDGSREKTILKKINLSVRRGETVLVIGKSGSGKTTLARSIIGLLNKTQNATIEGEVLFKGKNIVNADLPPEEIKYVGQNPYIYFVEYHLRRDLEGYAHRYYGEKAKEIVLEKSRFLGLEHLLDRFYYFLSGGEARRVAILKAIITNPEVLILDEPLMWVDDENVLKIKEIIRSLRSMNVSVIIFEHRFMPLLDIVDNVYLLKNGILYRLDKNRLSATQAPEEQTRRNNNALSMSPRKILSMKNVVFSYDDARVYEFGDFELSEKELIVLLGRNGSGKSTFLKLVSGQLKPKSGSITWHHRCRTGYLPQKPIAFFTEITVMKEIEEVCKQSKNPGGCRDNVEKALKALGINDLERSPFSLSWGEQVRTALALLGYSGVYGLLLLDEPFTGLDYYDRYVITGILNNLVAGNGVSVIIAASTMESLSCLNPSHVYHVNNGRLVPSRDQHELSCYKSIALKIKDIYEGAVLCSEN